MPPKSKVASASVGPTGWQKLYNTVVKMRQQIVSPVDVIGCDRLSNAPPKSEAARFHTLVALMLSAQTRDYCTAEAVATLQGMPGGLSPTVLKSMPIPEIVARINMVGMYNVKAKHLKAASTKIVDDFGGVVPTTIPDVMSLPGVGPKMAHLFTQSADATVTGIGVDVHVHRIAQRWKWVPSSVKTPEDTRIALEKWLPVKHWPEINEILVGFGQTVCLPRNPKCQLCAASVHCPNAFKESPSATTARKLKSSGALATASSEHATVEAPPPLCGDESADDLLALCGGSSEVLLERGWLNHALPEVKVPPAFMRRFSDPFAVEKTLEETADRSNKRHRAEQLTSHPTRGESAASVVLASRVEGDKRSRWVLADVEDLCGEPGRGGKTPQRRSKYFP